jgi:peptidoglycan/xylan/chitin deacetylase (PgdA/CDA1 family)
VVSLDFELYWGMRDHSPLTEELSEELIRSRELVPKIADELCSRSVRATWATVGFLFASRREELETFKPAVVPRYERAVLDPYTEQVGADEELDPVRLAGSVVKDLAEHEGQEIGSHSFSHFYCLEPGQDEREFKADLIAARAIARHAGLEVTSLVLARNQWNPAYARAVRESGFTCYRGPQRSWGYTPAAPAAPTAAKMLRRAARLADTYAGVSAPPTTPWDEVLEPSGLCNVPASAFLRPYSPNRRILEPARIARLVSGLRQAARRRRIFHLWWHPHNFVRHPTESFDILRRVLDEFDRLSSAEGMRSLAMGEVAGVLSARGA